MDNLQSDMTLNKEENMEDKDIIQDEVLEELEEQSGDKPEDEVEDKKQPDEKKFSQAEVDKILKSRLDRELKKFKEELTEAEKLAKMSEEDRAKLEMEKMKAEFDAEKIKFQQEKLELEATKILGKEGLPVDFAPLLLGENAEETKANIDSFKSAFQEAVEKSVEDKLKGGYTPKKSGVKGMAISKEEFDKMTASQLQELAETNPALYKQLKGQA